MVQSIDAILKNLRSNTQVIDPWERIIESASFKKMIKGLNDKLVNGRSLTRSYVYRSTMIKALKGPNFWRLLHSKNLIFATQ